MIRMTRMTLLLFSVTLSLCLHTATVFAASPREQLKQYISDLQRNPDDYALREKIIRHVQTMEPKPILPEEARRHLGRGMAAFKGARNVNDYKDAVSEFMKASNHAPWVADIYRNLGVAQDKAGQYGDAIRNLKLCIVAAPESKDADEIKGIIYEIEYRQEKAFKETEKKKEPPINFGGLWYDPNAPSAYGSYKFIIDGTSLTIMNYIDDAKRIGYGSANGRKFEGTLPPLRLGNGIYFDQVKIRGTLSEDNNAVNVEFYGSGFSNSYTLIRK